MRRPATSPTMAKSQRTEDNGSYEWPMWSGCGSSRQRYRRESCVADAPRKASKPSRPIGGQSSNRRADRSADRPTDRSLNGVYVLQYGAWQPPRGGGGVNSDKGPSDKGIPLGR